MKKLFLIIAAISIMGCSKDKTAKVKYTVLCDCKAQGFNITYIDQNGNIVNETVKKDMWEKEFIAKDGDYVSVLSQANALNAEIAARVYYNGSIIEVETKKGDYIVVIAAGNLSK